MQTTTLTNSQAINSMGGPSLDQLQAIGELPRGDRWPVLEEFGQAVRANLPADVQVAIERAVLVAEIEAVRATGDEERADLMASTLESIDDLIRIENEVQQGVREGWIAPESSLAKFVIG